MDWLPIAKNDPLTPGDYLVEIGPFPVDLPTDIPGVIIAGVAALFSTQGMWDVNMRGAGTSLFISFRVPA